jgi:hypothetical protein
MQVCTLVACILVFLLVVIRSISVESNNTELAARQLLQSVVVDCGGAQCYTQVGALN